MIYVQKTPTISDMYVTNVVGPTQGVSALSHGSQRSGNGERLAISVMEAQSPALPIKSKNTFPPLPTSYVQRLEDAFTNHPDQKFVSRLCNNLRYGADMGFTGRNVSRFSSNLPSAISQPSIVTINLSSKVALGRVAGPSLSLPLPNFQVLPIGIVSKKHTATFGTIFHLSFPKLGETSINSKNTETAVRDGH